jgi:DNA helicase-2/ATP-dependent DNA helicase PcrA
VRAGLARTTLQEFQAETDGLAYLRNLAGLSTIQDPETRKALNEALSWSFDLMRDGSTPEQITGRIRVGASDTLLNLAGVHLLNAHLGKGQQFDWVVVVGSEDGVIPDFRATRPDQINEERRVLSVMISRARHGVLISFAREVPALDGRVWPKDPSRFLSPLRDLLLDPAPFRQWLEAADWTALV